MGWNQKGRGWKPGVKKPSRREKRRDRLDLLGRVAAVLAAVSVAALLILALWVLLAGPSGNGGI